MYIDYFLINFITDLMSNKISKVEKLCVREGGGFLTFDILLYIVISCTKTYK